MSIIYVNLRIQQHINIFKHIRFQQGSSISILGDVLNSSHGVLEWRGVFVSCTTTTSVDHNSVCSQLPMGVDVKSVVSERWGMFWCKNILLIMGCMFCIHFRIYRLIGEKWLFLNLIIIVFMKQKMIDISGVNYRTFKEE